MTVQASVAQIRGRVLAPAPLTPTWWWFRHLIDLGDEEAEQGRPTLATTWYELACENVPELSPTAESVFVGFVARARLADDAAVKARRYRAACAVACQSDGH